MEGPVSPSSLEWTRSPPSSATCDAPHALGKPELSGTAEGTAAGRQPPAVMFSAETGWMSSVETGQMSAVETGQMSAAETGQMSAVETRQMYSIKTGQRPVAIVDICLVSTADICPVSAADICPVSTADICPVSTEDIWLLWVILGRTKMISTPFLYLKCAKWNTEAGGDGAAGAAGAPEMQPQVAAWSLVPHAPGARIT